MPKVARRLTPTEAEIETRLDALRTEVRASAQDRPGVYRMIAEDGEIIYVGKSKRVRTRLLSYFRAEYPADKGARIVREAFRIEWEYEPSEFAALLGELRAIKRYRPRFNFAMKRDDRNFCFIKVTRGPAPRLLVVRGHSRDESGVYYGPFSGAMRTGEAIRELGDLLGLRDCSAAQKMHFADQEDLFTEFARTPGCIRFEVRKCAGPCVGGCTATQYDARVAKARAFLDGLTDSPVDDLRGEMERASEALEYERAAVVRDKLHRVEALREQFEGMRFAVESLSFVYTVAGVDGDDRVYLIRRGCIREEARVPRTADDAAMLLDAIDRVFGTAERKTAQIPTHEIDELLLLTSWFKRFPEELEKASRSEATVN